MNLQVEAFIANLDSQGNYTRRTTLAYASDIRQFLKYLVKHLGRNPGLDDFNARTISTFLKLEKRDGRQTSTLLRRHATLRRFEIYLQEKGMLEQGRVVVRNVLPKNASAKSIRGAQPKILTEQDIRLVRNYLIAAQHPRALRDLAIVNLLLDTGISIGTLVSINISDINFRAKRIMGILGPKHLLEDTVHSIKNYLEKGRPEMIYSSSEEALFISQVGHRVSRQGVWHVLRNWGKLAGISQELSPRVLRHTAAYKMVHSGYEIIEIQKMLGHKNRLSTYALVRRLKSILN